MIRRSHRRVGEIRPLDLKRLGVEAAQRIVLDPADKGRAQPHVAQPRHGVADRPARRLGPFLHRGIKHLAPLAVDKLHDALFDPHPVEELVVALGQHVDHGIPDADNIIALHRVFSS